MQDKTNCEERQGQPGGDERENERTQRGIKKGDSPSGLAASPFFRAAFRFALHGSFFRFVCLLWRVLDRAAKRRARLSQAPAIVPFVFIYPLRFLFFYAIIYRDR